MPNLLEMLNVKSMPTRERAQQPVNELLDLHGKRVAITGGHGPNFGQAITDRLAGLGASVALVHRAHAADAALEVATRVTERYGVTAVPVVGDMSDWDSAHGAAQKVVDELGGLDVWINSAGAGRDPVIEVTDSGSRGARDFWEVPHHLVDASVTVLLQTMLYGTHAALGIMVPQKRGRIINIASAAGMSGIRGQVLYATMKAGVIAFTEFVARETGPEGVTAVCVAPGTILSPANMPEYEEIDDASMTNMQQVMEKLSIGRFAWPEEPANLVAFLASDAGAYVHGATLKVAGGR